MLVFVFKSVLCLLSASKDANWTNKTKQRCEFRTFILKTLVFSIHSLYRLWLWPKRKLPFIITKHVDTLVWTCGIGHRQLALQPIVQTRGVYFDMVLLESNKAWRGHNYSLYRMKTLRFRQIWNIRSFWLSSRQSDLVVTEMRPRHLPGKLSLYPNTSAWGET